MFRIALCDVKEELLRHIKVLNIATDCVSPPCSTLSAKQPTEIRMPITNNKSRLGETTNISKLA
jgi:hypothetical protein